MQAIRPLPFSILFLSVLGLKNKYNLRQQQQKQQQKPEFTTSSAGLHHQPQVKLKYFLRSIEENKTVKTADRVNKIRHSKNNLLRAGFEPAT